MKTLLISFLIILSSSENILLSQENLKPFIISPFIGEKLDRIEEDYFHLFSGVASLNEATFYLDADSSLFINIKFYENNLLKDTLIISKRTPQILRDKINEVILNDIKKSRVEELEFITENNEKYEGTVFSFDSEQIKLIENGFAKVNDYNKKEGYISLLSYSKIAKIQIYKSSTGIIFLSAVIGAVGGWFIGNALAEEPGTFYALGPAFLGGTIGSVVGYLVSKAITAPKEYDTLDSETKKIISENSLLPNGL